LAEACLFSIWAGSNRGTETYIRCKRGFTVNNMGKYTFKKQGNISFPVRKKGKERDRINPDLSVKHFFAHEGNFPSKKFLMKHFSHFLGGGGSVRKGAVYTEANAISRGKDQFVTCFCVLLYNN